MPRNVPLVTQYLENVSREALEKYQDVIKGFIRRRQGIYALYRKGKLYYVGLARNLRARLKTHLRDRHGSSWDRFSVYLTIGDEHMKELESLILRMVGPSGNRVKGKFIKAENLKRKIKRVWRERQREEEARLFEDKSNAQDEEGIPDKSRKSKATGRRPVLGPYINAAIRISGFYKGKTYKARVRSDGTINYKGKIFNSPSVAGAKAIGRRSLNGWKFWKYERSPGDWVPLTSLRK